MPKFTKLRRAVCRGRLHRRNVETRNPALRRSGAALLWRTTCRTVRVMGQKFVLDTAEQAAQVQKSMTNFYPSNPKKPLALDLSGFQSKGSSEKRNEGDAFLRQLQGRVSKIPKAEAAELRAKALDLEAKGYKGVAAQAEKYITYSMPSRNKRKPINASTSTRRKSKNLVRSLRTSSVPTASAQTSCNSNARCWTCQKLTGLRYKPVPIWKNLPTPPARKPISFRSQIWRDKLSKPLTMRWPDSYPLLRIWRAPTSTTSAV